MHRKLVKLIDRCRVSKGRGFRLKDHDPADTGGLSLDKDGASTLLKEGIERLTELQDKLYAQDRWALLAAFQAMDAAGKDGTIKHVMSGVNPQGVHVTAFKAPTSEELDHDFLWRVNRHLPERGRIGIFNRSHYEEVLVVRVHRKILQGQKLPRRLVGKNIFDERLEDIAAYERYLSRQGVVVRKIFLNVSRKEQKRRFLERIEEPEKNWKFSAADVAERGHWDAYMEAYEAAIRATATPEAPWFVVPADSKWYTRLVVAGIFIEALESLDLDYPRLSDEERAKLISAKATLDRE
jgi:PPK2 family polyphosphate:nucleotide phosphotransferase